MHFPFLAAEEFIIYNVLFSFSDNQNTIIVRMVKVKEIICYHLKHQHFKHQL